MARYEPIKDYSANLVANYKFNETSGTTCIDSKGVYNGTFTGTTSITENGETFRRFNGTSDYVGFTSKVIPIGKKSIKFRIRTTNTTKYEGIINNSDGATTNYGIFIYTRPTGEIAVGLNKGVSETTNFGFMSNKKINDGLWHDVMFTWDGTVKANSVCIYIDDMINADNTTTANSIETTQPSLNLTIGRYATNYFKGDLDELEIYNEVIEFQYKKYYLIQNNQNLYSINNSFYPVGQTPTKELFEKFGTDDLTPLTQTFNKNNILMQDDGTVGIGKQFSCDLNSEILSINEVNME